MNEIPCTDDFVQKNFGGERLPSERDKQPPGFACTEPITLSMGPRTIKYTRTLLQACANLEP